MLKLKSTRHLLLGIFDFVVIGVVIYGLTDWVYDGYPKWVPYSIMAFFLIMASVRFYMFSANLKKSNSVDSHDLENLFAGEPDESIEDIQPDSKGFRKRGKN